MTLQGRRKHSALGAPPTAFEVLEVAESSALVIDNFSAVVQGDSFRASAPESCSPVVCNKPDFETVGCLEEVSRFQWVSLDAQIKYTCQAGFTTTGETSGGTLVSAVGGTEVFTNGVLLKGTIRNTRYGHRGPLLKHTAKPVSFSPIHQCRNVGNCRVHTCPPHGTCVDGQFAQLRL